MDLYGRRKLEDANGSLPFRAKREMESTDLWYHYFALEDERDTPYNVNLTPFNGGNTPAVLTWAMSWI